MGFGEAEARRGPENHSHRFVEGDEMAGRDEDRSYAAAGPEDGADQLIPVEQRGAGAALRRRLDELSHEAGLGAAYGRDLQLHSEVAGKAEPLGMGDSLAIDDEEIGPPRKAPDGFGHVGGFTKREQAGNVGEGRTGDDKGAFNRCEGGKIEEDGHGNDLLTDIGRVYPGCGFGLPVQRFEAHAPGKGFLESAQFCKVGMSVRFDRMHGVSLPVKTVNATVSGEEKGDQMRIGSRRQRSISVGVTRAWYARSSTPALAACRSSLP
ncbi:MAG: hypothetical protein WA003_04490 [Desulfuromonadaceae bacterium]